MRVSIIGLGLIGGSIAIDLKKNGFATHILGCDKSTLHAETARHLGIIDEITDLDGALGADLIVLAVPVDATLGLLPGILDKIDMQVVTDVGSTKATICHRVHSHPRRGRFVPAHPMAGTEHSGPWAAHASLFEGCAVILCDPEVCDQDALGKTTSMYAALHMRPIYMDSVEHDAHAAYVSHISHISSFALALTVLEKEHNARNIFDLASGGFSSTVRLAKSSPDMWTPIFTDNADNVVTVLDTYLQKMQAFRDAIIQRDHQAIDALIAEANGIKRILG